MSLFEWKNEYNVGIMEIDAQHRRLFSLAADLHSAMTCGKGKETLSRTFANLIAYTKSHFAAEERIMQAHHYPDFAAHKAEHVELTRRVMMYHREFEAGGATLSIDVLRFLREWLEHHIKGSDRKYVPCVQGKNAA